jgi:hypothetical protein
LEASGDDYECD